MQFEPQAPPIGVATLKSTAKLYRVRDGAVIAKPANTRNVYCHADWGGISGYLVTYKDEAHLLKESDCTFAESGPTPVTYKVAEIHSVTVGGKPVVNGSVTLP